MMTKHFKAICEDCLMSYEIGDKFTAKQFSERLLSNYSTRVTMVSSNRVQSFFRGNPKVRMCRPKNTFATYERVE